MVKKVETIPRECVYTIALRLIMFLEAGRAKKPGNCPRILERGELGMSVYLSQRFRIDLQSFQHVSGIAEINMDGMMDRFGTRG